MNITKKTLKQCDLFFVAFFFLFFFSIQTVAGCSYYGFESPLPYIRNSKSRFFFNSMSVNQLFNNSIALGSLAICAQAHH